VSLQRAVPPGCARRDTLREAGPKPSLPANRRRFPVVAVLLVRTPSTIQRFSSFPTRSRDAQLAARSAGVSEDRIEPPPPLGSRQRRRLRSSVRRERIRASSPTTSTIFVRLVAPVTRRTCRRRTRKAAATAARAASVARPSTARAATATTSASPYAPPTLVSGAPGRTLISIRTAVMLPRCSNASPLRMPVPTVRRRPRCAER